LNAIGTRTLTRTARPCTRAGPIASRKAWSGAEIRSSAPRSCHNSTTKSGFCDTRRGAVECPW